MATFVYVDNSNVWIEGMRVAAVANGLAPDIYTAIDKGIFDYSWNVDFGRLYEFVGGQDVGKAMLYGSRPPDNDSLWAAARARGFEVVVFDRNVANREKKIDTTITRDITKDSLTTVKPGKDIIVLVAGDTDYVPVAEDLRDRKISFEVAFWDHASHELKNTCKFVSLNPWLNHLRLSPRAPMK